jgi:hypothetical protein
MNRKMKAPRRYLEVPTTTSTLTKQKRVGKNEEHSSTEEYLGSPNINEIMLPSVINPRGGRLGLI